MLAAVPLPAALADSPPVAAAPGTQMAAEVGGSGEGASRDAYRQKLELDLKVARAAFDVAPNREDSYIWLGRRYGYLGHYDKAIEVFSAGLEKFPDSYKLLRFRGRHLARSRQFAAAIADYQLGLEKMRGQPDSFEPNGIPNALDLTTSTYRQNLHYYLGQTSFAVGDYHTMFEQLEKSREPLVALPFDDHEIAVIFWQTIALRKQSRHDQAKALLSRLQEPVRILENATYYKALRVLTGRTGESGEASGDNLSRFALAMRREFEGDVDGARGVLEKVIADNAKGYWPAEVALAQLSTGER